MHTGKIKRVVTERGFGFIADTDGNEVFFHRNSLKGIDFDSLSSGQAVEFEVTKTPKGPNAINVSVVNKE